MRITHRLLRSAALFGVAFAQSAFSSTSALADVERLVVTSSMDIGPYQGKEYRYVVGTLRGTAPGGPYAVPVQLAFPIDAEDFNGFALIDIASLNTIGADGWPEGGRGIPVLASYGHDYLFGNGNFYVTVFWDKEYLDRVGAGIIGHRGDTYEIFRDVAALARDPAIARLPIEYAPARGADRVIAAGYSASAAQIQSFLNLGLNQAEGPPVFDGALLGTHRGPDCDNQITDEELDCDTTQTDGAKVISVVSEFDPETRGPWNRGETETYRQVEIAGVAHVPASRVDLRPYGVPEQNPIDASPVYRAALENLQLWLDGTEPPPSIYIDLSTEPTRTVFDEPFWDATRDADGNALGGVRLPHMAAPLGVYRGVNENTAITPARSGGTFTPFSAEEIRTRYPNRESYVAAVTAAAADLVANRYILREDADAYITEAQAAPFWN